MANVLLSTCKSSKQTQHVSASLSGFDAGLVDDDPAEEDDDFVLDLEVVDVVSLTLAVVVSLGGFNALVSDSMPVATSPVTWVVPV